MKKLFVLVLALLLSVLPAFSPGAMAKVNAQEDVKEQFRPKLVTISYSMYEGDCDLEDSESRLIAWKRTSEESNMTDRQFAEFAQFRYTWYLDETWEDTFKPSQTRICTDDDHSYVVHLSVRVHRGAWAGARCATWTDKRYICTNCGAKYTDLMLDRKNHIYKKFICTTWVPSLIPSDKDQPEGTPEHIEKSND